MTLFVRATSGACWEGWLDGGGGGGGDTLRVVGATLGLGLSRVAVFVLVWVLHDGVAVDVVAAEEVVGTFAFVTSFT